MEKFLVKEFASTIIAQSKGKISVIDAEALAIVYLSKMKKYNVAYLSQGGVYKNI